MQLPVLFSYKSVLKILALNSLCHLFFLQTPVLSTSLSEQLQSQIQDTDQKIQYTQSAISACNNTLNKLAADSVAAITSYQANTSQNKSPLSDIDKEIASLSQKVTLLNKQIFEVKQDSSLTVHKLDSQKISFSRESTRLQQLISAASSSIKSMTEQRDQHIKTASLTSNNALVTINAENARIDLLLSNHHNELTNLNARREKLKQDSILLTTQLYNIQTLASSDQRKYDSLIATVNHQVQLASNLVSQAKTKRNAFLTTNNQILQNYTAQRAKTVSNTGLISANLTNSQNEYNRIRTSLNAIISKYESGKAPLVKRIREIDSTLHTRQMQKTLWKLMDEKWSVDSAVSAKRNELDEIIQQAAVKRKNAMKLTEQKEAELNALLGKLDQYLEKPGVKQAASQLNSLTAAQRKARIQEVRSNIDKDIITQTARKEEASKALAAYEKNNPATNNPSVQKLQQLEKTISSLQKQKEDLSRQKDSLDALIGSQTQQISKADAGFQKEIGTLDSSLSLHSRKSISLSSQRTQVLQKHTLSQKTSQDSLNKIVIELKNIDNRIAALNRDIILSNNRKEQIKAETVNLTQAFEQQKTQAGAAAQNLIGLIASKEQESASHSAQLQQLTQQHGITVQELQTRLNTLRNTLQSLNSQLFTLSAQQQNLQKQQSSLNLKLHTTEQDLSKKISEINTAKIKTKQELLTLQSELQQLNTRRTQLAQSLEAEKERQKKAAISYNSQNTSTDYQQSKPPVQTISPVKPQPVQVQQSQTVTPAYSKSLQQYDSLIKVREQELLNLRAQREKTLQENQVLQKKQHTTTSTPPTPPATAASTAASTAAPTTASAATPAAAPAAVKRVQPSPQSNEHQVMSQKIIEHIYTLLGEDKKADAYRLFTTNKKFLQTTAPVEAIRILESSFIDMQPGAANANDW